MIKISLLYGERQRQVKKKKQTKNLGFQQINFFSSKTDWQMLQNLLSANRMVFAFSNLWALFSQLSITFKKSKLH